VHFLKVHIKLCLLNKSLINQSEDVKICESKNISMMHNPVSSHYQSISEVGHTRGRFHYSQRQVIMMMVNRWGIQFNMTLDNTGAQQYFIFGRGENLSVSIKI
jgi:hypothetical protein